MDYPEIDFQKRFSLPHLTTKSVCHKRDSESLQEENFPALMSITMAVWAITCSCVAHENQSVVGRLISFGISNAKLVLGSVASFLSMSFLFCMMFQYISLSFVKIYANCSID